MSSSRSDGVFSSVHPFFSFSVFEVSSCPKEFNGVSRQFKGCLKFTERFKDVSRKFKGCFKNFKSVSK